MSIEPFFFFSTQFCLISYSWVKQDGRSELASYPVDVAKSRLAFCIVYSHKRGRKDKTKSELKQLEVRARARYAAGADLG